MRELAVGVFATEPRRIGVPDACHGVVLGSRRYATSHRSLGDVGREVPQVVLFGVPLGGGVVALLLRGPEVPIHRVRRPTRPAKEQRRPLVFSYGLESANELRIVQEVPPLVQCY